MWPHELQLPDITLGSDFAARVARLKNEAREHLRRTLAKQRADDKVRVQAMSEATAKSFDDAFPLPQEPDSPMALDGVLQSGGHGLCHAEYRAPCLALVRKLLARLYDRESTALANTWTDGSNHFVHARCTPLGKVPALKLKVCYLATFCRCEAPLRPVARIETRFGAALRFMCRPKTGGRLALKGQSVVIRFLSRHRDDEPPQDARWAHVSYTNLVNWDAILLPLEPDSNLGRKAWASPGDSWSCPNLLFGC